jgi:acyl carrier protein
MTKDIIQQVLSDILGVSKETITEQSSMDTIPQWDSLKHMNIVIAIEEEFDIVIPDNDAANITSFQLIQTVVEEHVN